MIDHVYLTVNDPERSLAFYLAALAPLDWREFGRYDAASSPDTVPDLWGITDGAGDDGVGRSASIWLRRGEVRGTGLYLGLAAADPAAVDAAYVAALAAGGRDDGPPGMRLHFADGYYAANVCDLDGNQVEIVHKGWNPAQP